jgi:hypothetical protein
MPQHLQLNELAAAVQSAVEQALGEHGAVPIDKIWVGFVAPENVATAENATRIASTIGREGGVAAQASVGTLASLAGAPAAKEGQKLPAFWPGHILGLFFDPKVLNKS